MKVAIYQGPEQKQSVEENLQSLEQQAKLASAQAVSLLITPEMFLTGYNIGSDQIKELAEKADGESASRVKEIARRYKLAIVYGYPEREHQLVYNAAQLIDENGNSCVNYRKTHLFGDIDRNAFSPGQDYSPLFEFNGWTIGLLICYDVEFPENVRLLAMQGVDLLLVPTALMKPYSFVAEFMVATRAFENQIFVAYVNRCGSEQELDYYGLSCVVGPDGIDLARADASESLLIAQLDKKCLQNSRHLNTHLQDRRPALYQKLTEITED